MAVAVEEVDYSLYDQAAYEAYQEYRKHFGYFEPTPKQLLFIQAGKTAKERLFLAGNRTGKTFNACLENSMHVTGNYSDNWDGAIYTEPVDMWAASVSAQATRDVLQKQYYLGDPDKGTPGLIHESLVLKKTRSAGVTGFYDTVWVQHASGGVSTISFKSYDQGREKFQGTQKHIIHLDEEPPRDIYVECLMRTASTKPGFRGILMLTMTPLLGTTDMVLHFTEGRPTETVKDNKYYVMATWDDNPHLSEEEKETLLSSLKPHEIEARTKGIPSLGSGLVYPVPESMITCAPFEIPKHWGRVFGMDFGWTDDTAVLFLAHDKDSDTVYAYAEYAVPELSPQIHATTLLRMGANWIPGVCDPSAGGTSMETGAQTMPLYQQCGISLSKANNKVELGVQTVLQRMQTGRFKIFTNLTKTLGEIRMYSRDQYGFVKKKRDKDHKKRDHLMDSLRYGVMSGLDIAIPENFKDAMYHGKYGRPTKASYI